MSEKTIIEKFKTQASELNGNSLSVTPRDMVHQVATLYENRDVESMRELFHAYVDWEVGNRGDKTVDETVNLAEKNFNTMSRVADWYIENQDLHYAFFQHGTRESHDPNSLPSPKVSNFCREVLDYSTLD